MKKILLSLGSILFAGAVLASGTGAFIGDTETSTGNTFATGVIDLKVDNESYVTNDDGLLIASPASSWSLSDLPGKLFFNFLDIKPGDIGEDTISLHINTNKAWACMAINLTSTPENGQPEPETEVDTTVGINDGELQNNLYFKFWADDGDNVYEQGESIFKYGLAKDLFNGEMWALSDSSLNIWGGAPTPIPPNTTKYIGKAWCFGNMTHAPVAQDGLGKTGSNGPLVRGTGFVCSGTDVGNIVQSDGIKADVSFYAAQSRSNNSFLCAGGQGGGGEEIPPSTSTLFSDNFNSCQDGSEFNKIANAKWDQQGGVQGDEHGSPHGKVADLDAGTNQSGPNHTETLTTTNITTTNYHNIILSYDRNQDIPSGTTMTLTVDYSVNGGTTWTNLETVTTDGPWVTKTWNLSPSADNKSNVKIRFKVVGTNQNDHAYIDNISITGITP
ncbi:MAG: hypothetical protein RL641_584 [Candidatus Parcubacteria bacterium]|jgi:hypothetical protein